ncbi:MAG: hypothetical protein WBA23_14455 [Tunicatimonas sp.]|uniref:hypothetical protein n=1 Tax=Tunicatimonas sp. TaxID=1940096 RepID=UPI003C77C260
MFLSKFYINISSYRILFVFTTALLLGVFSGNIAWGQMMMVDKAYTLLKQGQLRKSQQAINIAIEHNSTVDNPKAWYLRSYIYQQLAEESTDSIYYLRNVSIAAAKHCITIDSSQQFATDCRSLIAHAYTGFLNDAIALLNGQKYSKVLLVLRPVIDSENNFAQEHRPEAFFYYGYAMLQLNNPSEARKYLYQSLQLGYQDALIYEVEATYRAELNQFDSARWYLAEGRKIFPQDANMHIAELNFLMQREYYQEAEQSVVAYLEEHPNDVEGLLLAGTIYEKLLSREVDNLRYFDQQRAMYERVLQIAPNHIQANYNLGIAYYNRGVNSINGAAQNYELDIIEFNQLLEECSTLFLSALPYLKKVSELDQTHVNALKALQGVYYNINDYEQYSLVKEKLQKP